MRLNNEIQYINYRKVLYHTLGWITFILVVFVPLQIFNPLNFSIRITFGVIFPVILPVYIHFFLLDFYFDKKKYLTYSVLTFLIVVLSSIFAQWFIEYMWMSEQMNMIAFLNPLLLMIITSGARSYYRGIKLQLQLQEVQTKQYQAELDLLRFQINPHFFFNTLNNLFSMARKQKDESTSKGIAKLSHIMRYIIYDCNVDKIELEKEIDMINNFIELQKLRFSDEDDIKINFGIVGELQNQEIAPMLLVPFVENAFKHGISLKNMSPINIKLKIETETLIFSVRNNVNKLRYNRENEHSGIGLQNVKRRLELLYPNKHELLIENIDDKFDINLKIDL